MNPKVKKAWLKALRSGEYKQTRGQLKNERSGGMCCLGVLCDIAPSKAGSWMEKIPTAFNTPACTGMPPNTVRCWAELKPITVRHLAHLNDRRHWGFKKIADWIEETL